MVSTTLIEIRQADLADLDAFTPSPNSAKPCPAIPGIQTRRSYRSSQFGLSTRRASPTEKSHLACRSRPGASERLLASVPIETESCCQLDPTGRF